MYLKDFHNMTWKEKKNGRNIYRKERNKRLHSLQELVRLREK